VPQRCELPVRGPLPGSWKLDEYFVASAHLTYSVLAAPLARLVVSIGTRTAAGGAEINGLTLHTVLDVFPDSPRRNPFHWVAGRRRPLRGHP
jgi:hypothetical protein